MDQPQLSPWKIRIPAALLGGFGLELWLFLGKGDYGHRYEFRILAVAILAGLIPPVRRGFNWLWETASRPPLWGRYIIASVISILSMPLLVHMEVIQRFHLRLHFHDEYSYWLQTHILAHGRLWMPTHPLPDFFASFYVFASPVYASMYFPGTALWNMPAIWLHLPYYAGSLVASGFCVGLFYLIVSELFDGATGLLAAILLLSVGIFRLMSVMLLSEAPMLLMGLALTFAYLRWHRTNLWIWAILMGIAAGWGAITRPLDGAIFAVAIGVGILMDLWRKPRKIWLTTAADILLGAAPFLGLQLIFNHGVTGHWLYTPFSYYTDQNAPGAGFGFHPIPPNAAPVSPLPQQQQFYQGTVMYFLKRHQNMSLFANIRDHFTDAYLLDINTIDAFFWVLIPISVLGMWNRRLWAVWGVLPVYFLGYAFYAWQLNAYAVVAAPALLLLVLIPIHVLGRTGPLDRAVARTVLGIIIAGFAIESWPIADHLVADSYFTLSETEQIDQDLAAKVVPPAVVMFHFNTSGGPADYPWDNSHEEPVYNSDYIWPDDAPVVRVHDLNSETSAIGHPGDRDLPLYEYFEETAPKRVFYLYDRHFRHPILIRLGTASEIIKRMNRQDTKTPS